MTNFITQGYLFTVGPTVVLSLALSAVAVSYIFLHIKLNKTERDKLLLQSKIRDQTYEILKDAHQKRLRIIQEAMDRSRSILKDVEGISVDIKDKFSLDLKSINEKQEQLMALKSKEISKLFSQFNVNLQQSTEKQFNSIARNMENKAVSEIEEFRKTIEDQSIFIHKQLDIKLNEEYKKAQKNIEDYKLDQMNKFDKKVFDIIHTLTRDLLGRTLSLKDHEDLIQKGLAQMKKDMSSEA